MSAPVLSAALLVLSLTAQVASAQSSEPPAASGEPASQATAPSGDAAQVEELRRRVEVLAAEVEKLRSGEPATVEVTDAQRRALGLSPSAAATYRRTNEGVSFAGYGEMLLEHVPDESATELDFLRAVLYTGYRFNDKFLFNSELEVEHGDEVGIEFAYLDYLANRHFTVRAGMILIPLGLVNEFHEPTVFIGARRPETERRILPSTWHENGAGVLGTAGIVNFRAYVVNGFSASGFTPAGVRDGRQGGAEAAANDFAFAGRLDITPVSGIFGGVGVYTGGAGQGDIDGGDVNTTIAEVHGQAQIRGFDARALYARASLDDAAALNLALRRPLASAIAERMEGGYVQFGYNVLSQHSASMSLTPFVRFEHLDTQARMPAGFFRQPGQEATLKTFGAEFKPIPNIVVKADYQWITNDADAGHDQFNLNLGYAF